MNSSRRAKHGGCDTRLYRIWVNMKARCNNPNRDAYKNYGGRGVRVCEQWNHDFVAFRDWAVTNGYTDELTIEREDNDSDYEPSNCTWIPRGEQTYNRRSLPSRSGYYGVKFVKRNTLRPWVATLDKVHLGSYATPEEAHEAIERAKNEQSIIDD